MITAGLAFALQRVVTAIAGYVVILRGKTFSVGDRIVMGGVRGDVIELRFTQTVIWLELSVRSIVEESGIRNVKDRMSREILAKFDEAGIGIASATFELVGDPKMRVALDRQ